MSTEFPPIDRDKSPLFDADHDPVRIAEALRRSPHFAAADADPGGDTVQLTTEAGLNYTLTFKEAPPTDDDLLPEPVLVEAIAAAILNHPGFVIADAGTSRETITVQSRNLVRHLLVLDIDRGNAVAEEDLSTPAVDVAFAADQLLASAPSDSERATAELLNYVAATWGKQDKPLREHAQAVARALPQQRSDG